MSPLTSQQGEVADRLRSFFLLTGRVPTSVDETVVPTALVQALDQPPFRVNTADFMFTVGAIAVVGQQGFAGAILRRPGAALISTVWIRNLSGAAASEFKLYLRRNAEVEALAALLGQATNVEQMGDGVATNTIARTPVEVLRYFTVGLDANARDIGVFRIRADETIRIPIRVVLRGITGTNLLGATAASTGLFVAAPILNAAVDCTFFGTYFPEG